MSSHKSHDDQPFVLKGRFLGFLFKDGYKIKYVKVLAHDREWLVEVAKPLRKEIPLNLPVGEWVQLSGWQTYRSKYGVPKFKAEHLTVISPNASPEITIPAPAQGDRPPKAADTILVCGKSDCWKRGGKELCAALKQGVSDRHLDGLVSVQTTGCMKQCKKGPNLVVMPNKQRCSRVSLNEVNRILDEHFVPAPAPESVGVS